jgi:hypothetical protein
MTKINLVEMNELALKLKAEEYRREVSEEHTHRTERQSRLSSNELARMEMARELLGQGLTMEAVCRILNVSEEAVLDHETD